MSGGFFIQQHVNKLFEPVDGASIAVFRIFFGALMLWDLSRFFSNDWINSLYIEPRFNFPYQGFEWVHALPESWIVALFALTAMSALFVMLGLFYRVSILLFFCGFSSIFLLEKGVYLNHFYLIILIAFLMCWIPAHGQLAVDNLIFPNTRKHAVPRWCQWILLFQLSVVYFYGGLAKINPDWLQGEPIRMWLRDASDTPLIGRWFNEEWMVAIFAYGGLVFDLIIAPLLLYPRTRTLGVILALAFHLTNAQVFSIGVFPWMMIASTTLYFPPDWPRHLLNKWLPPVTATPSSTPVRQGVVIALCVYMACQLLIPFRYLLYPGNSDWTEKGHTFAWRMKLREKTVFARLFVTEVKSGRSWEIMPRMFMTRNAYQRMITDPDMLLSFVNHWETEWIRQGGKDVEIRALVLCSLNAREPQLLIDPTVDLSQHQPSWGPYPWVLALTKPLKPGYNPTRANIEAYETMSVDAFIKGRF